MDQKLKTGDQVQLLSGGPTMTVQTVDGTGRVRVATCQWFAGKKLEKGKFLDETLKIIDGAQKKS